MLGGGAGIRATVGAAESVSTLVSCCRLLLALCVHAYQSQTTEGTLAAIGRPVAKPLNEAQSKSFREIASTDAKRAFEVCVAWKRNHLSLEAFAKLLR